MERGGERRGAMGNDNGNGNGDGDTGRCTYTVNVMAATVERKVLSGLGRDQPEAGRPGQERETGDGTDVIMMP